MLLTLLTHLALVFLSQELDPAEPKEPDISILRDPVDPGVHGGNSDTPGDPAPFEQGDDPNYPNALDTSLVNDDLSDPPESDPQVYSETNVPTESIDSVMTEPNQSGSSQLINPWNSPMNKPISPENPIALVDATAHAPPPSPIPVPSPVVLPLHSHKNYFHDPKPSPSNVQEYPGTVVSAISSSQPSTLNGTCAKSLAGHFNDFSDKISQELFKHQQNVAFSPYIIFDLLTMVFIGSGGKTAQQMDQVLFGLDPLWTLAEQLRLVEAFNDVSEETDHSRKAVKMYLADKVFLDKDFKINDAYKENLRKYLKASVQSLDFDNGPDAIRQMNSWATSETQDMIPTLFDGPFQEKSSMVLGSAAYFKAPWLHSFSRYLTKEADFYGIQKIKRVMMMTIHGATVKYLNDPQTNFEFLELPYKGDVIKMILALPLSKSSPANGLRMDNVFFCYLLSRMTTETMTVKVPRFNIAYSYDLKEVLQGLGMTDLFDAKVANLTGMATPSPLRMANAYPASVKHRAGVRIDEEGATEVTTSAASAPRTTAFVADHPFLFYVYDTKTKIISFAGLVVDP